MTSSLYFFIYAFFYIYMSSQVIKGRRSKQVSLGHGKENEILHLTSAHNNFSNYTPLFFIGMILLEVNKAQALLVHILFIVFFIGRFLHFTQMKNQEKSFKKRVLGMILTFMCLGICSFSNLFYYIDAKL